ncbi:tripartite tricarboxylate transporter substrate binding protein (plasmid) [Variovorax sp. V213]|uniref:Bug family tripartite tricarboxylate transporter substrate binding protein n=1 Tax=Variovorax sp. V213 TaxID=3065955 RepID=UPI0034E83DE9
MCEALLSFSPHIGGIAAQELSVKLNRRQATLCLTSLPLLAQQALGAEPEYPNRPVRLVVPYGAGGGIDAAARRLARELETMWGQSVVVDNKGGGDSIIGTAEVAHAKPDGYTILAQIATIAQNPHLRAKMPFDTLADLTPVVRVSTEPLYFAVTKSLGVNTIGEFIELARRKPGKLSFGSYGNGSTSHLLLTALQKKAKVEILHVPYKSTALVVQGLMTGEIDSGLMPYTTTRIGLDSGKVLAIGSTGATRSTVLPQVPTLEEAGLDGFTRDQWMGLFAPAKTPRSIVDKIARDVTTAVSKPEYAAWLKGFGVTPAGGTPNMFDMYFRQDYEYYRDLIKAANVRLD